MAIIVNFGGIGVDISKLNFNDHSSRVAGVNTANVILISMVASMVSLRLFARIRYVRQIFIDDFLILSAAATTIALSATCIAATGHGLGTHIWLFPMTNIFENVKECILYLFICQILYAFAIAFTKAAIIMSYLRFIPERKFRILMYVVSFVTFGLWVCGVFVCIFQCKPIEGAWNILKQQSCINYVNYLYASSSVNALTDIILCISPMPHLWKLNMPRKQRVVLCILFTGGAGACIAGIVRMGFLHNLRVLDVTFETVPSLNLSVIECSLGIIFVSVPALRPIAVRIFPNGLWGTRNTSRRTQSIPLSTTSVKAGKPSRPQTISEQTIIEDRSFRRLPSVEAIGQAR